MRYGNRRKCLDLRRAVWINDHLGIDCDGARPRFVGQALTALPKVLEIEDGDACFRIAGCFRSRGAKQRSTTRKGDECEQVRKDLMARATDRKSFAHSLIIGGGRSTLERIQSSRDGKTPTNTSSLAIRWVPFRLEENGVDHLARSLSSSSSWS